MGAGFLAYNALTGPSAETNAFTVRVSSPTGPLAGASVQILDGKSVLDEGVTNAQGVAKFTGLPKRVLTIQVFKTGSGSATQRADLATKASVTLRLGGAPTVSSGPSTGIALQVVDALYQTPVAGASVAYSAGGESNTLQTDASGTARLPLAEGSLATLRVTNVRYKPVVLKTIIRTGMQPIRMIRNADQPIIFGSEENQTPSLAFSTTGTAVILATDANATPIQNGSTTLYDAFTNQPFANGSLESGVSTIDGLNLGQTAYAGVNADGFLPFVGNDTLKIEATTVFNAVLQARAPGASDYSNFTLKDAAGKSLDGAVYVFVEPAVPLAQQAVAAGQTASIELATNRKYYAVATSNGYLPSTSPSFEAGSGVDFVLQPANSNNSATLNFSVVDFNGESVSGASVILQTPQQRFVLPSQASDANGKATFTGVPFGDYVVKGESGVQRGSSEISVSEDAAYILQLETPPAFAAATAVDAITNQTLNADFTSYYLNPDGAWIQFGSCSGANCTLSIRSNSQVRVTANAAGYLPWTASLQAIPSQQLSLTAQLEPTALVNGVSVTYNGLFDRLGNPASVIKAGGVYTARFTVNAAEGLDQTGFYLRAGAESRVSDSSIYVLDGGFPISEDAQKSASYQPGPNCTDADNYNPQGAGELKWVDLVFNGTGTQQIDVKIKARDSAASGTQASVFYRAYGTRSGQYTRDPADAELGSNANASTKAGCYAAAKEQKFNLIQPSPPDGVNGTEEFTAGVVIRTDPQTGKILASEKQINLQIDALYPADAVPLQIGQNVLFKGVTSSGEVDTSACYAVERAGSGENGSDLYYLSFKSGDFNPACPIKVNVNDIAGDDSANLTLYSASNPDATLTLAIHVKTKSATSIYALPQNLPPGDHTARLLYVINQKQASRQLQLDGATKQPSLSFSGAGAHVFAWDGQPDGTLSLSENNTPVFEWSYNQQDNYFSSLSSICQPAKGAANNYLACAQACCTLNQFRSAVSDFVAKAKDAAKKSAFRRGNAQPLQTLATGAFQYSMVAQVRAGVSLRDAPVSITGAESVDSTYPSVFIITARSADGKAWSYGGSIASINWADFVNPPNTGAGTSGQPANTTGPGTPLHGYMYTDGNSVKTSDHCTLSTCSSQQNEADSSKTLIPIPSGFVQALAAKATCKASSDKFKIDQGTVNKVCTGFPMTVSECQTSLFGVTTNPAPACKTACETKATQEKATCTGNCVPGVGAAACKAECDAVAAKKVTACTACSASLAALFTSQTGCDANKHLLLDVPALLPFPRWSWMTCCAAQTGQCIPVCEAKQGFVMPIPIENKVYLIIHFGIDSACNIRTPPLGQALLALTMSAFSDKLGQYSPALAMSTMFFAFQDSRNNMFGKTFSLTGSDALPPQCVEGQSSIDPSGIKSQAEDAAKLQLATTASQLVIPVGKIATAPDATEAGSGSTALPSAPVTPAVGCGPEGTPCCPVPGATVCNQNLYACYSNQCKGLPGAPCKSNDDCATVNGYSCIPPLEGLEGYGHICASPAIVYPPPKTT